MSPSPIGKALSIFRKHRVRALLMGGQACILYGAAEFSRDLDLAVLASADNLRQLRHALEELQAEPVFFPPLSQDVLLRGHACHFRVQIPQARGLRVDIMSVLHGCDPFADLWTRRRRLRLAGVGLIQVLALPDLVQAKKTQRDKDWPMVRRLVEIDYHNRPRRPSHAQIRFWLNEARTAPLLVELCASYPGTARRVAVSRSAVAQALRGDLHRIVQALRVEEESARARDHAYWRPLRQELEQWRHGRRRRE